MKVRHQNRHVSHRLLSDNMHFQFALFSIDLLKTSQNNATNRISEKLGHKHSQLKAPTPAAALNLFVHRETVTNDFSDFYAFENL